MGGVTQEKLKAIEEYKLLRINLKKFLKACESMFEYKVGKENDDFTIKITAKKDYPHNLKVPYTRGDIINVLERFLGGEFNEHELWHWATFIRMVDFYDCTPTRPEEEHDLVLDILDDIEEIGYYYFDRPIREYVQEKIQTLKDFKYVPDKNRGEV